MRRRRILVGLGALALAASALLVFAWTAPGRRARIPEADIDGVYMGALTGAMTRDHLGFNNTLDCRVMILFHCPEGEAGRSIPLTWSISRRAPGDADYRPVLVERRDVTLGPGPSQRPVIQGERTISMTLTPATLRVEHLVEGASYRVEVHTGRCEYSRPREIPGTSFSFGSLGFLRPFPWLCELLCERVETFTLGKMRNFHADGTHDFE